MGRCRATRRHAWDWPRRFGPRTRNLYDSSRPTGVMRSTIAQTPARLTPALRTCSHTRACGPRQCAARSDTAAILTRKMPATLPCRHAVMPSRRHVDTWFHCRTVCTSRIPVPQAMSATAPSCPRGRGVGTNPRTPQPSMTITAPSHARPGTFENPFNRFSLVIIAVSLSSHRTCPEATR